MAKEPYNPQSITDYLLGALSENETIRFDELSFTDEQFNESLGAAERELIDRYVLGELQGQQLARFESRYLTSPVKREKIEMARAFQEWCRKQAPPLSVIASAQPGTGLGKILFSHSVARWKWQWGFAAFALVLLTLSGWFVFEKVLRHSPVENRIAQQANANEPAASQRGVSASETQAKTGQQQVPSAIEPAKGAVAPEVKKQPGRVSIASIVLTPQMRDVSAVPVVTIPSESGDLAVELRLEPNESSTYRVSLLDQTSGEVVWRSNRVAAQKKNGIEALVLKVPAALLKSRSYVFQAAGLARNNAAEIVGDYHFRVVK